MYNRSELYRYPTCCCISCISDRNECKLFWRYNRNDDRYSIRRNIRSDNKGCTTAANYTVIQPAAALAASAIGTNVNCFGGTTGTMTVTASGGTSPYTYVIAGPTVNVTGAATGVFTGLTAGAYTVTVTDNKGCTTTANYTVTQPAAALAASAIGTNVNCFGGATGTMTAPASGGTSPYTYSWNTIPVQTTATATNLAAGTYTVTVTDNKGCTTTVTVTITEPPVLSAPTVNVTQPTCAVATGTITVTAPTGAGLGYSIDGVDYSNTTGVFTNVIPNTYSVTVKNAAGCISPATSVTINTQPQTPGAPTVNVTQPTCAVATGTITVTAPTGAGLGYSIDGVDYSNTTGVFTNVIPNTYSVAVKNAAGCISPATSVTINTQPQTPAAPTVNVTQPTCAVATGTITVTAPTGAGLGYSIDGVDYSNTTGVFTNVIPNTYSVTVKNAAGCISLATSVTINAAPPSGSAPTVSVTQPTCAVATGTITVSSPAPAAGISYSIDGTTYTNTTGVFTAVAPGPYNVTVKNAAGCISPATAVTVNAAPPSGSAPTVSVTTQPTCAIPTGTITVTAPAPAAGIFYSIDGTTYTNTTGVFTAVAPGPYNVTVKNAAGCISPATAVTVNT